MTMPPTPPVPPAERALGPEGGDPRPRPFLDVADLPDLAFGSRDIMWWGTLGFVVIEGFTLALCLMVYLYLWKNYSEWPPAPPEIEPDFAGEIEQSGLFEDVRVRRYVWERLYTADEYIALLETFSGHIAMDAAKRERLYGEVRARLGTRRVQRHWYAVLHIARSKT